MALRRGCRVAVSTMPIPAVPACAVPVPWNRCLLAALPGWLLARVVVVTTFALAGKTSPLVWDVAWYHDLGVTGYGPYGAEGSRFFPLLPALVGAGAVVGLPASVWLVALCWVAALFFAAALFRLTVLETGDEAAGRRAAWLIQLVPGANVLALGYTEAVAGLLAVLYFLALRSPGRARLGFAAGVLSGLVRPTGPALAVPGFVAAILASRRGEAPRSPTAAEVAGGRRRIGAGRWLRTGRWRRDGSWRDGPWRDGRWRGGRWLVAVAPLVGTGAYLAWTWSAFGDPLTPYRIQSAVDLRGGLAVPPWGFLVRTSPGGYPWPLVLALLAVAAGALYLCWRLLPAPYVWWALPMVGLAVTAWGLHSLPRYLAAVFPLWMAVAVFCRNRWAFLSVLAASGVAFTWVAWLTVVPGGPVP